MPFWDGKIKLETIRPYEVLGDDNFVHVSERLRINKLQDEYEIVLPEGNQLQLDFDVDHIPNEFWDGVTILHNYLYLLTGNSYANGGLLDAFSTNSSNGNIHLTVTLPFNVTELERVTWQAALGSDRLRELASMISIQRGILHPTLFIERIGSKRRKVYV